MHLTKLFSCWPGPVSLSTTHDNFLSKLGLGHGQELRISDMSMSVIVDSGVDSGIDLVSDISIGIYLGIDMGMYTTSTD